MEREIISSKDENLVDYNDDLGSPKANKSIVRKASYLQKIEEDIQDVMQHEDESDLYSMDVTLRASFQCSQIKQFRYLLRTIQMMCDGGFTDVQNYLRDQSKQGQLKTFNLIIGMCELIKRYVKICNLSNIDLGIQILATTNDLICGPNEANVITLVNGKIVDFIREILNFFDKDQFKDNISQQINELKKNAINILTSMVLGNSDYNLMISICSMLSPDTLKSRLKIIYQNWLKGKNTTSKNVKENNKVNDNNQN